MHPFTNQYPWYQTPYNPHVYLPPQFNDRYPHPNQPGWQFYDRPQSKYPQLNPALAADMTQIRYDLRKPTRDGMLLTTYQQVAHQPVFAHAAHDIRIVSKAFPWTLDIHVPAGTIITCGAIFEGLYTMLQEPIVDSEWGIVVHDKPKKETVEKAAKARNPKDKDGVLKRIDWLGEHTAFKGLERDEEFEKKRLLPGVKACKETWLIKFAKP